MSGVDLSDGRRGGTVELSHPRLIGIVAKASFRIFLHQLPKLSVASDLPRVPLSSPAEETGLIMPFVKMKKRSPEAFVSIRDSLPLFHCPLKRCDHLHPDRAVKIVTTHPFAWIIFLFRSTRIAHDLYFKRGDKLEYTHPCAVYLLI